MSKIVTMFMGLDLDAEIVLGKSPTRAEIRAYDERVLVPLFKGRCAVCIASPLVCFHEIEPKSRRPKDWWLPSNRLPVCDICHNVIHETGAHANADALRDDRERLLSILNMV